MADPSKLAVDLEKLIERAEMAKITTDILIADLKKLLENTRRTSGDATHPGILLARQIEPPRQRSPSQPLAIGSPGTAQG